MSDNVDRKILRLLQGDPGLSGAELAQRAGITPGRAARRVERMRTDGVIIGQEAVIDWRALGFAVQVSLRVQLDKTEPRAFDDFLAAARKIAEVIELQTFLGRVDVRLSVIALDLTHYQDIYRSQILGLPHISDIESLMTISTVKSDEALPL